MLYETNAEYLQQLINEVIYLKRLERAYIRRAKAEERSEAAQAA